MDIIAWTSNIRRHCDLIDGEYEKLLIKATDPRVVSAMLDYTIRSITLISTSMERTLIHKTRAYKGRLRAAQAQIDLLLGDLALWRTDGVLPQYIDEDTKSTLQRLMGE